MIFNFAPRPLMDVKPWGTDRRLHWFGLTDGWYWIQVGDALLYQYTDAMVEHWSLSRSGRYSSYADYQIARLFEDLWDILPWSLETIPADILTQNSFVEYVWDYASRDASPDIADPFHDLVEAGTKWWSMRELSRGHLIASPFIRLWRVADVVKIGWDNQRCLVDGEQVWTAMSGVFECSLEKFIAEVKSFRDRLQISMQQRIDEIQIAGGMTGIRIDIDRLVSEQQERFPIPDLRLDSPMVTDWNAVRAALKELHRILPHIE
jgi:hypothetical protein